MSNLALASARATLSGFLVDPSACSCKVLVLFLQLKVLVLFLQLGGWLPLPPIALISGIEGPLLVDLWIPHWLVKYGNEWSHMELIGWC